MGNHMLKYYIQTFGCAMNLADSERFRTILNNLGFIETAEREEADILIFNTCSVRQKAEDRIFGLKPEIEKLKAKKPELITILSGCMARRRFNEQAINQEESKEARFRELKRQAGWLDIIIETKDFHKIGSELKNLILIAGLDEEFNDFLSVPRNSEKEITAGITISHGCDHMCTYCIVPFARGREIARDYTSIIEEVKSSINSGTHDILLLGQTVNRWINPKFKTEFIKGNQAKTRIDGINETLLSESEIKKILNGENEPKDFLQLLQVIDELEGDFHFSFISSHPNYYTKELIEFIADSVKSHKHIRPFIHLALQSGNDEVLKKMNRNHTVAEFAEKVKLMRKSIPYVSITTDIIVGFPGETEAQFIDSVNTCKALEFDQIFISEYSARKGTGSALLKDNITQEIKTKRKDIINEVLKNTALNNNKKLLNTTQKVLILQDRKERYYGRTLSNKPIEIGKGKNGKHLEIGNVYDVQITDVTPWSLFAETANLL